MSFLNDGQFPLYELQVRVVDVGLLQDEGAKTYQEMEAATTYLQVPAAIAPHTATGGISGFHIPIRNSEKADFNVFFSARNGFWSELIRIRKVKGLWVEATRVQQDFARVKTEHHPMPWTNVEKGFPLKELSWN